MIKCNQIQNERNKQKMRKREKTRLIQLTIILIIIAILSIIGYFNPNLQIKIKEAIGVEETTTVTSFDLQSIPEYENQPYVYINNNIPNFEQEQNKTQGFEKYSQLDSLGRCGVAYANICKEIMPAKTEERGSISNIYPTGWKSVKYQGIVDNNYLYNRSHLIGWQLAGENANKKNLITGTRYMNVEGMLPFENMVDDYFEKKENKNNHVLYRVTPIFKEDNLIASGVQMEAYSVEDEGKGVCFNVYVYNVQPGIEIDYKTGNSKIMGK